MLDPEITPADTEEYLVAGHSNTICMGAPWDYSGPVGLSRAVAGFPFPAHGFFVVEPWKDERSAEYWECLVQNANGRHVILSYAGNQHVRDFLFAPDPLIDFFDPSFPDDVPLADATLVPRTLVKDFFRPSIEPLASILSNVTRAGAASVTVIGTPPPRAEIESQRDFIQNAVHLQRLAKHQGVDLTAYRLTPPGTLKKFWGALQELLDEVANAAGARFVPVPGEACDSRGFLRDSHSGDFTHGNHLFGLLMFERALAR